MNTVLSQIPPALNTFINYDNGKGTEREDLIMIEISHLVKKYGNHYAVKDLSVRIEEGQIYGFLGPNGAGKSTTMNIVTCLLYTSRDGV